jgi:UDP-perosamine 4-acetyltransferase
MRLSREFFEDRINERLGMENRRGAALRPASLLGGWDAAGVSAFLERELHSGGRAMERVIVIGAGGHARVAIEILEEAGCYELAGCTGEGGEEPSAGLPLLGDDAVLPQCYASGIRHAFVALGDNRARRDAMRMVTAAGFHLINAVSRRAAVSPRARLGQGVAVMAGAVVQANADIGEGAIVNTGASVDHDCRIGAWAHIAPGARLCGGVTIGEGALLGAGSSVTPGVAIGAWTVVGAGAAVVRSLPAGVTAVGVPARVRTADGGAG